MLHKHSADVNGATMRPLNESSFESLFGRSVDMLCLAAATRFVHLTGGWQRALGWSPEELAGESLLDFVHPDDLQATISAMAAPTADRPAVEFENRYRCKDGDYRWLQWSVSSAGETLLCIARDVSIQKETYRALERSGGLSHSLLETCRDGVATIDHRGMIRTVNSATLQIFGYQKEELIGRNVRMLMPDPFRSEHDGYIKNYIRTGEQRIIGEAYREVKGVRKSGEEFFLELTVTKVETPDGLLFAGFMRDISVQKAKSQELIESHKRFESVVRALSDGIVLQNGEGVITYCNDSAERILGLTVDQMNGRSSMDPRWKTIHPDGRPFPGEDHPSMVTLRTGRPCRAVEMGVSRPDGSITWILVNSQPIMDADENKPHAVVASFHDITNRKEKERIIEYQAYHDSLTGLGNRALLKKQLEVDLARARENESRVAILFLDLDRFKRVNDSFSHAAGDWLLQAVADRLRECARPADTIIRQGGDEFVVVLPDVRNDEAACDVARQICVTLSEPFIYERESQTLHISTSIGIAVFPDHGREADALLKNADAALYLAKERDRDGFAFYSDDLNTRSRDRLRLEGDLHQSIKDKSFTLHYQPQFDLKSRRITGFEALIRWPVAGGLISPIEFIPLAEETGLIVPLGQWVFEQSARDYKRIAKHMRGEFTIAVNCSRDNSKKTCRR
jgi:diguanylate cyclase (GGDEF)-like protein/PAS domain S-box-containing protein